MNSPPQSLSRKRIACVHCRRSHTKCDGLRPCKRCVGLNKQSTCQDPPSKLLTREPTSLRPRIMVPTQEPKTSWWGQKGDSLLLLSCTPSFSHFIQYSVDQVVQRMKLSDLFLENALVLGKITQLIRRNVINTRVDIDDLWILTKTGLKKRVTCWVSAVNNHRDPSSSSSSSSSSSVAPSPSSPSSMTDSSPGKIIELTLFEINPSTLLNELLCPEKKGMMMRMMMTDGQFHFPSHHHQQQQPQQQPHHHHHHHHEHNHHYPHHDRHDEDNNNNNNNDDDDSGDGNDSEESEMETEIVPAIILSRMSVRSLLN